MERGSNLLSALPALFLEAQCPFFCSSFFLFHSSEVLNFPYFHLFTLILVSYLKYYDVILKSFAYYDVILESAKDLRDSVSNTTAVLRIINLYNATCIYDLEKLISGGYDCGAFPFCIPIDILSDIQMRLTSFVFSVFSLEEFQHSHG